MVGTPIGNKQTNQITNNMKVTELTTNQLAELRQWYNYDRNDSTAIVDETDIPDSVLYEYYGGIEFTTDDFFSNN